MALLPKKYRSRLDF